MNKKGRFFGAVGLIAGTTIGAAMLALPVETGCGGFFPALVLIAFIWLYMLLTAFYFLELSLHTQAGSNLITMAKKSLGRWGEGFAWVIYLLLLYSLIAAYIVSSSQILTDLASSLEGHLPHLFFPLLIFILFSSFLYFGTQVSDLFNRLLLIGLFGSYFLLLFFALPHVNLSLLSYVNWKYLPVAVPVVATSFGYHIIIPTLVGYLDRDVRLLKRAIVLGSIIPFVIYLLWQLVILGIIPATGEKSLQTACERGRQATLYLKDIVGSGKIAAISRSFAFFAIITSLLGVSLSLSDFLADGLKIKKTKGGKLLLALLVFLPPLFFALFYPSGFLVALRFAGIFVILLLALLPALMVYYERYRHRTRFEPSHYRVGGGKSLILLAILIALLLLGLEVMKI